VYILGVFYCNHTCPDVIFCFGTICVDGHVCISFCPLEVYSYVVVFWVDPSSFDGDLYFL
jgi:hypothetical protein